MKAKRYKDRCEHSGKRRFPTRLHAEIRILSVEKKAGCPIYSYQCQHCDGWHFSRTPEFTSLIQYNLK